MADRPILLGMNNPQGNPPLWPAPVGSSGWRLWRMMDNIRPITQEQYIEAFDRRNILSTLVWDPAAASAAVDLLLPELLGRRVVMLGREVSHLCRRGTPAWLHPYVDIENTTWYNIPHPSGRVREYNDPEMVLRVGQLLLEISGYAEAGL